MENFTYYNPTRLHFGKGQVLKLEQELSHYGKNVLLVYGSGSIFKNGVYDDVYRVLSNAGANIVELGGIEPNPRVDTAEKGIRICRDTGIDFILAVGGGSVIDCVKLIAAGAKTEAPAWDIVTRQTKVREALPFGVVLTLAATGSEMNSGSVITNWQTKEKYGWGSSKTFPQFAILDPAYTFSVPKNQTIYGIVDSMSHVLEHYFHEADHTEFQDRMCEGLLLTIIEAAPDVLKNPENYDARATLMYGSTMALNGMLNMGYRGDWATHNLEHAVSAVHDIPHGGGLAILFPRWMRHYVTEDVQRFRKLATRVFHVDTTGLSDLEVAMKGIEKLEAFWESIGAPTQLAAYNVDDSTLELMVDRAMRQGDFGNFATVTAADAEAIFKASF
ncbi:iron-containing alcohol dehydrogenase [Kurthia huakuii]|uniref:iron-containing alcohol dehydrogenase n=1 Tax=Kurthia huakuii TaxID=1421019 RepID=UPI000497D41B|nr:iron-containing alcohol dehydrogenase [Kurthia huakuii]MBM7699269.1 alcohol dehydrogenase YqhD (iron-dependent ADH family) [Kurthia huakuii]